VSTQRSWQFVLKDPQGHYASVSGLAAAAVTDKLTSSGLVLTGTAFAPDTKVSITYLKATIGHATVSAQGTVRTIIQLLPKPDHRYRLRMTDSVGRTASVTGSTTQRTKTKRTETKRAGT
jgi:hypothetical protein